MKLFHINNISCMLNGTFNIILSLLVIQSEHVITYLVLNSYLSCFEIFVIFKRNVSCQIIILVCSLVAIFYLQFFVLFFTLKPNGNAAQAIRPSGQNLFCM